MSNINLTKGASQKSILHQGFNFPKLTLRMQAKKFGQSTLEPLGTQLSFFHLIKYTIQNFLTISSHANGCFLNGRMKKGCTPGLLPSDNFLGKVPKKGLFGLFTRPGVKSPELQLCASHICLFALICINLFSFVLICNYVRRISLEMHSSCSSLIYLTNLPSLKS